MNGSVIEARPLSGQGTRTLQDAYDADTTAPQLVPTLGDNFNINGQVQIEDALDRGEAAALQLIDTASVGAFVGGGIQSTGTITYTATTFIWALLQESKTYVANAGPGFAAFTLFNALAGIQNGTANDLVQALVLNNGLTHRRVGSAGTSVAIQTVGLSNSPQTRSDISGGVMTKSVGDIAVNHRPTYSVVLGGTVNLGSQWGLRAQNPSLALFGSAAGIETLTAYFGVDVEAIPFGGNVLKRGFRSSLAAATNTRAIECLGTAQSDFRGQINFPVDLVGNTFGASGDWSTGWAGAGFFFEQQNTGAVEQMQKSYPAAGRMLIDWSNDMEFGVNCVDGFSLGAQTGGNGNQFGNFVAGARTTQINGEWSDFLLTQAANLTVDDTMSLVAGWTINAPSMTLGAGSVTDAGALNIGGNVNQGSVNRFGVRILSNPSGGSGVNAALWVTAGSSRFDGRVDINNGVALGGGAAATLGTIGGSGPTAAAQAQWVEIDIGGTAHWIPVWT